MSGSEREDQATRIQKVRGEGYGEDFPHLRFRVVLEVTAGKDRGKRFEISSTPAFLGRFSLGDAILEDESVSRSHAVLYYEGGRFHLKDLKSTNGTYVNGVEVTDSPIGHRDLLTLGAVHLQFLVEERP